MKAGFCRWRYCRRCRWHCWGRSIALTSLGVANNLYTQIGLILMIALSAKNGILIVEMAREGRMVHGKPILEAAVEASRMRFRPILMTSFAFGMGVLPLVLATGAGANRGYFARIERAQRHHRLDLPRGAVRPVLFCGAAAFRRSAQGAQTAKNPRTRPHRDRRIAAATPDGAAVRGAPPKTRQVFRWLVSFHSRITGSARLCS